MTFSQFATVLLMGLITNNMISVSATGADMAMNRLDTVKNALIYGLVASIVIISSTLINLALRPLLVDLGVGGAAIIVALFVIAVLVQISEAVCERIAPRFVNEISYFVPLLASTCAIVAINIQVFIGFAGFLEVFLTSIAYSAGLVFSLAIIAGITRSFKYKQLPHGVERVVLSLLILLILVLAFTAFR